MAEALGPNEPVGGYVTFVAEGEAGLTVRFRNSQNGPIVEAEGSQSDLVRVSPARTQSREQAAFIVTLEPASS